MSGWLSIAVTQAAVPLGQYHLAVEAVKKLKSIENTSQESEIRRLGRAVYPADRLRSSVSNEAGVNRPSQPANFRMLSGMRNRV
jgi:hypothetical protein